MSKTKTSQDKTTDVERVLTILGFKPFSGPLWRHTPTMIIINTQSMTPDKLLHTFIEVGENWQKALIRKTLGIKN